MDELLFPAVQKFYSALNNLAKFNKEKNFFDNISSLDTFFSEFRNITFVIQKSLKHTKYIEIYEKNRDKFLRNCRWFVEKRNETTKQSPFELVKQIEVNIYFSCQEVKLYSEKFTVKNDVKLSTLIESFKELFFKLNPVELFFSAEFTFFEKEHNEDIFKKLISGIYSMKLFLESMLNGINEKNDLCKKLMKKIEELIIDVNPNELKFINDYAYYPQKNIFEKANRFSIQGPVQMSLRVPLTQFNVIMPKMFKNDNFRKFIFQNVIIGTTDLMPTIMIIYKDNTFSLDIFHSDLKTTFYRKINETAEEIRKEEVKEVYYMQTYVFCPYNDDFINMSSKERLASGTTEYLTFMKVDYLLNENEYSFEGSKIKDKNYIVQQLFSNGKSKLEFGQINMLPIIEAFSEK